VLYQAIPRPSFPAASKKSRSNSLAKAPSPCYLSFGRATPIANYESPMAHTTLLTGKVLLSSLPAFHGPPGADAPKLKRLLLAQGQLAQVYDGEAGIRYLACIELREGKIRGNHYHRVKDEFIYVITGQILLAVEDISTGDKASTTLNAGDLAFIPVTIAHAFRTVEAGHGIEFSPMRFDAADICPYPLILDDSQ